jgi:peptidoglycan-associated lipoprotein
MSSHRRVSAIAAGTALLVGLAACQTAPTGRAAIVKAPQRCIDTIVQIYFDSWSADLNGESRAVIDEAAALARGCTVAKVEVLGLADAEGAPAPNLELSKKRASAVTAALAKAGLPAAEFRLAAAGQAGATTANGDEQPMRRRADVVLRLQTP